VSQEKKSFRNFPNCHSGSRLDEFCARLFDFKKSGTYVDIGSAHSRLHNNSHFLDVQLGWRGLCVELNSQYNESYTKGEKNEVGENWYNENFINRKQCTYVNGDATKLNYAEIFAKMWMPSSIDYLSLDVDELDLEVAKILLPGNHRFKVVGIEHDAYRNGNKYRDLQRELFLSHGYVLACADMFVRHPDIIDSPFEDWYLDSQYFSPAVIEKVKSESCYPDDVIVKLGGQAIWA
jgi:hypothetical protein